MSTDCSVNETIIRILQATFGSCAEKMEVDEDNIPEVEMIASRQSILCMISIGLKNMGYSSLLTKGMNNYIAKATYDYIQRREALFEISSVLETSNIDYIPLKGAVLRDLYPQPCMRESSDVDVLVPEDSLKQAIKDIEHNTHFKCYKIAHHDAHFVNERVHLELHFSLLTNIEKYDHVLSRTWNYTVSSGNGCKKTFAPEFQIFYITVHSAKHFSIDGGVGIRPLLDLWLLRTKTNYQEDIVRELCSEAGILGYYETCCSLLNVWFGGAAHTDVTAEFEKLVLSGGVFGSKHTTIISRERRNQVKKKNYTLSRVFRTKRDIQEFFPRSKKHPSLVPIYQVVRWTRLVKPSKRKAAREELRQRRMLDSSEVERYDWLLKKMGM